MGSFRFGSLVSVLVSVAVLGAAACSGKSAGTKGAGGAGGAGGVGGASAGTGGTTGGTGGASGNGTTGGSAGKGSGGTTGGSAGSGGATGGAAGNGAGQGGSGAGTGGSAGSGASGEGGDGGQMNDDRPVLERPVREEQRCTVTAAVTNREFPWSRGDLAATVDGAFLVWGRPSETAMPDAVVVSSIDATGTLGAAIPLATYAGVYTSRPRVTASSRGMTVAWTEAGQGEMSELRIAELDSMGAVSKMPATVMGVTERIADAAVAPTASGNAVLFVNTTVDYMMSRVRVARLDANAAVVGTITDIETTGDGAAPRAGALIAVPGGFAATYTHWGTEAETFLAFVADDGSLQGEPLSLGTSRPLLGQSLFVRGDELIVAYGDQDGSYDTSDIAGFIALARFDLGTRTQKGAVVRVQTPTVGEETVDPVLFAVGEDIGLLWSRGTVIYVCAGCMPDNHLEAVIMDGDDFTPISTLLTLPNNEPMGGFVTPVVAPLDDSFVVAADLRFHVSGNAATGAFQCSPVP